jgi:hypothetical protein
VQRDVAGWKDAKDQGHYWNAEKRTVGTVDRYPLQLAAGGFPDAGLDAESAKMTSESAMNRAIALVPAGLEAQDPVTVLLHFHGHVESAKRPYASWREHSADKQHPERTGKVRDVARVRRAEPLTLTAASRGDSGRVGRPHSSEDRDRTPPAGRTGRGQRTGVGARRQCRRSRSPRS